MKRSHPARENNDYHAKEKMSRYSHEDMLRMIFGEQGYQDLLKHYEPGEDSSSERR